MRIGFGHLVDIFLVSAVACVFGIRSFLSITGYPQIGVGGLHVAHVVFGGIGMAVALVLVMASLTRLAVNLAAVIGGLGFGAFIDEIGKFVTSDNNYFYRPAVALIYMIFVVFYVVARAIEKRAKPSPATFLANALDLTKEGVVRNLDAEEFREAQEYISHCRPGDPIAASVKAILERVETVPLHVPGLAERMTNRTRSAYRGLVQQPWFGPVIVTIFVATGLIAFVEGLVVLAGAGRSALTFSGWGELVSEIIIGCFVVIGLVRFPSSRLAGYRMFSHGVLVNILLAQVFAFYRNQFHAIFGLATSIVVWGITQYMIREEETTFEGRRDDAAARGESRATH